MLREGDAARPRWRRRIRHEPLGVVANVSAWNYPYFVGSNVFVPALLTGNAVLYKPSEFATLTGLRIAAPAARRGRARGRVHRRWSAAATWARRCWRSRSTACSSPAATPPARRSPRRWPRRLIKLQLELGGKDPDLRRATTSTSQGRRRGPGRRRLLQHRPELLLGRAHLRARDTSPPLHRGVRRRRCAASSVGDPRTRRRTSARWPAPPQLDVLEAQVADAVSQGRAGCCAAASACAGARATTSQPTVLADVDHTTCR